MLPGGAADSGARRRRDGRDRDHAQGAKEWLAIGIALAVLVVVYVSLRLRRTAPDCR